MDKDRSQLEIKLDKTPKEDWYKIKNKVNSLESVVEAIPFWKHFMNVFSLGTILINSLGFIYIYSIFWDKIPDRIPLFYSQVSSSWSVYPKVTLYIVLILYFVFELFVYYFSYKLYTADRRLSMVLNILIILSSLLYAISLWQILVLVLF